MKLIPKKDPFITKQPTEKFNPNRPDSNECLGDLGGYPDLHALPAKLLAGSWKEAAGNTRVSDIKCPSVPMSTVELTRISLAYLHIGSKMKQCLWCLMLDHMTEPFLIKPFHIYMCLSVGQCNGLTAILQIEQYLGKLHKLTAQFIKRVAHFQPICQFCQSIINVCVIWGFFDLNM